MNTFVQGNFVKDNTIVEVLGTEKGYRYRWYKSLSEEKTIDYSKFLPSLIVDFSWSMKDSNSAQPAKEATVETCKLFFEKGFPEVYLVFFGRNATGFYVNKDNYVKE